MGNPSLQQLRDVIVSELRNNRDHAVRSVSGGGCEKWLAGESRIAINWANPAILLNMEWVEVERGVTASQRADLVILTVDPKWKQRDLLAISEFKAVENQANAYVNGLLQDLKRQLDGHRLGQPDNVQVFGVIFAVWAPEYAHRAGDTSVETIDDFVHRLKGRIAAEGMTVAADGEFAIIFDKYTTDANYPILLRGLAVAIVTV